MGQEGFTLGNLLRLNSLPRYVQQIAKIDYNVDDIVNRNRLSVPAGGKQIHADEDDIYGYFSNNIDMSEFASLPYFSRRYAERKKDLHFFCSYPEIEFIIHSIGYDAVVYDENGFFLQPKFDATLKDEVKTSLQKTFKTIYNDLGFGEGLFAWEKFVEFLKIGYLAVEIIYDNPYSPTQIIGFEDIEPETIFPFYKTIDVLQSGVVSKRKVKLWKQVQSVNGKKIERILPDNSVIFIQYSRVAGNTHRLAYSERLIRNFNLKRTLENCKTAWSIMNMQSRIKIVVPVGTRNSDKAKQALAAINNKYKEDITIDSQSGEVFMNGQPMMNFGKTITLPSRQGQTPEIGNVAFEGPDMSSMDIVDYFRKELWRDSNLPFARFDKEAGGGTTILFSEDGITNDDRFYYYFLNTIRREFEQIIRKPLYIQALMDFPHLKNDTLFKSKMGFQYNADSLYQQAKQEQMESHTVERIKKLMELTEQDDSPLDLEFLVVDKYSLFTQEDWDKNAQKKKRRKAERASSAQDQTLPSPGDIGGDGGGGGTVLPAGLDLGPEVGGDTGGEGSAEGGSAEPPTDAFTP
jgi:hypothetical protein